MSRSVCSSAWKTTALCKHNELPVFHSIASPWWGMLCETTQGKSHGTLCCPLPVHKDGASVSLCHLPGIRSYFRGSEVNIRGMSQPIRIPHSMGPNLQLVISMSPVIVSCLVEYVHPNKMPGASQCHVSGLSYNYTSTKFNLSSNLAEKAIYIRHTRYSLLPLKCIFCIRILTC